MYKSRVEGYRLLDRWSIARRGDPLAGGDEATRPTTVTRSRWPRAFVRRTQKPFSALWNVTRSTRPASTSRVDDSGCGVIGTVAFGKSYGGHSRTILTAVPSPWLLGACVFAWSTPPARWWWQHRRSIRTSRSAVGTRHSPFSASSP